MEFGTPLEQRPWWIRYQAPIGISLIGLILIATLILMYRSATVETKPKSLAEASSQDVDTEVVEIEQLVFDIAGAVNEPGVYRLPIGSIVDEAIKSANGLHPDADQSYIDKNINLAEELGNHSKIYIPFKNETASTNAQTSSINNNGKINLNTANLSELDDLPGIGPVYAGRIVDYRNEHGRFTNVNELLNIQGIGSSLFSRLKDKITI